MKNLNVPTENLLYIKTEDNIYHPGKSSTLRLGKNVVAKFGEFHPILLKTMDVNIKVFGFEIYLDNIFQFQENRTPAKGGFSNNPYQMVERDFSFLFPKEIEAIEIVKTVKKIDKRIISKVTIFDVYEGDKLPDSKKSIAIRVLLQPTDQTFKDEDIENLSTQIIDQVSNSFKASIRE